MNNLTTHKATNKQIVPELRFKGFDGKWFRTRLLDEIKISNGQVDPKLKEFSVLPLIAPNHIESGTGRIIAIETAGDQAAISGKFLFEPGIVVYSKIRPYLKKAFITTFRGLCSADMYPLVPKDTIESNFLIHVILGDRFTKFANSVSARTGMPKINREELGEYFTHFPTLPEQQKIAAFLSEVDEKIQQLTKKKELLELYKKGVIQQLFSGKLRFKNNNGENYPDWRPRRMSEVLFEHKLHSTGKEEVFSVSVHKGLINQIEHLGRIYAAKNTDNYNLVQPGDIVYTKSPTGEFPLGIIKQSKIMKNVIVSPLYGIFTPETTGLGYMINVFFESPINTQNYLASIIQKGAKNTINITNTTFLSKKLKLPVSKEEQNRIGDFLKELDAKIEFINQQITQTKMFKKGLLQKMFV